MFDLLLKLFEIKMFKGDEFGFINRLGDFVSIKGYTTHYDYAANWLKENGIDYPIGNADQVMKIYCRNTGEIRYYTSSRGRFSVQVFTKITESQLKSISEVAKSSKYFDWDIDTISRRYSDDGYGEFTEFISENDLLEVN